jgi:hypothetical protein
MEACGSTCWIQELSVSPKTPASGLPSIDWQALKSVPRTPRTRLSHSFIRVGETGGERLLQGAVDPT